MLNDNEGAEADVPLLTAKRLDYERLVDNKHVRYYLEVCYTPPPRALSSPADPRIHCLSQLLCILNPPPHTLHATLQHHGDRELYFSLTVPELVPGGITIHRVIAVTDSAFYKFSQTVCLTPPPRLHPSRYPF